MTCAPADILYPADTKLLNTAREQSESLIDELHKSRHCNSPKPRTQRRKLRRQGLEFIKLKKPPSKRIRKFKRVLLGSRSATSDTFKHCSTRLDWSASIVIMTRCCWSCSLRFFPQGL